MKREKLFFKLFVSGVFGVALLALAMYGLDPAGLGTFAMFDNPTKAAWVALLGSYGLLLLQVWVFGGLRK